MRVLCLTDFPIEQGRWLWDYLPQAQDDRVEFVVAPPGRGYLWSTLSQARRALQQLRSQDYDLVAAWELKNGFMLALLSRFFNRRFPPLAIMAFAVRGLPARLPGLMHFALEAVNGMTVPSTREADYYQKHLNLPEKKLRVCANGTYDLRPSAAGEQAEYIFSGGYSNRDFTTLLQATAGMPELQLVCPQAPAQLPANVKWQPRLPVEAYLRALSLARLVVIPLQPQPYSTGLVDLLWAFAAGRPVIMTNSGGAADYVRHGENGLLVPPNDPAALRAAIQRLWDDPQERARLGQAARRDYEAHYTFPAFAQRTYAALQAIAQA
ncbi:MAG: glycosyltransferase family 4 protein [Anaerolineales bacterium]|nr:glycosyltransferase family 4 protein [Anaerolineales bacterium]